jgi:hypothetical protein
MGQNKKPTMEEMVEKFKKDNMAKSVVYEEKEGDEPIRMFDVPVVLSPGNCIFIYNGDYIIIVRWGKVLSVTFPATERMLRVAAVSAEMQDKFFEKMMEQRANGGNEVG